MAEKSLLQERDELLDAVKEPGRQASPNNYALYAAIVFANLIFLVLDVISGYTVYWLTSKWYYGVLTGLAGFIPLLLHEFLFTRAFASRGQKIIAVIGACVGLASILIIGVASGIITVFSNAAINVTAAEVVIIVSLVLIAFFHAILCAWYFYVDLGIRAHQQTAQAVARAVTQGQLIDAGEYILGKTQNAIARRHEVEDKYRSPAALREILRQMGLDKNDNGIPDFLEQPQRKYAQDVRQVEKRDGADPTHRQS